MNRTYLKAFLLNYGENRAHTKKYILGNVYRLPLYGIDDLTSFTNEFTTLLNLLKTQSNFTYLCGDYNIDILKMSSNHICNTFYENVISCSFAPKITLPTRICDTTSTLIDNVYTNVLDKNHTSGILIRPISDHQMYFCIMNENFRKCESQKKFIELEKFQNEIANLEMHNQLDANINKNPNDNYKIVSTLLQTAKNKHIPKRIVKFNKRRHKKERWMTNELLAKIAIKNEMYVDWKTTPVTSEHFERVKLRFKGYEKLVLKEIEIAKTEYFGRVFAAYRSDMKKTWQVISETLSRNKKKAELPSKFVHEGREIDDPTEIANAFNIYFAHIGKNLSSTIEQDDTNADNKQYLNSPTAEKLQFKCINEEYILKH